MEDSADKAADIKAVIERFERIQNIEIFELIFVQDFITAKEQLTLNIYDGLILDIQIPIRFGSPQDIDGGRKLLEELYTNRRLNRPAQILGVTQFENSITQHQNAFDKVLVGLALYSKTSNAWEDVLNSFLLQFSTLNGNITKCVNSTADLLIITALNSPELSALIENGFIWKLLDTAENCNPTYETTMQGKNKNSRIIAASALEMGMAASGALAARLIEKYRPRYVAMCGIAAGFKDSSNFGDIVIADGSWDYSSGKYAKSKTGSVFKPEPKVLELDAKLKGQFVLMDTKRDLLIEIQSKWSGETQPDRTLKTIIGPMFTGAAVIADRNVASELVKQNRKVRGIDMEAYAIFCAAKYAAAPAPKAFAIKSVCDHADANKDDKWQKYAAYTSAAYLTHWIDLHL